MFTKIGENFGKNALENEFPILPRKGCGKGHKGCSHITSAIGE